MTKQTNDPFHSISATDLASVSGGRLIPSKGPDPLLMQGIEMLVKTIAEVGQQMQAGEAAKSQQLSQMMQQMMEKRRAGG